MVVVNWGFYNDFVLKKKMIGTTETQAIVGFPTVFFFFDIADTFLL